MSKRVSTSVTLRKDHKDWLDKNGYNRSELINQLLDEFRSGESGMDAAIAEYRKRQIDAEIESLEKQLEIKEDERQDVTDNITTKDEKREQHWKDAVDNIQPPQSIHQLKGVNPAQWKPPVDNKKVRIYADRLGITNEEFIEQFPEKRREYDAI